jgi:integrase
LLPYYAGLRDGEVVRPDVGDVHLSAHRYEVRVLGKGSDGVFLDTDTALRERRRRQVNRSPSRWYVTSATATVERRRSAALSQLARWLCSR